MTVKASYEKLGKNHQKPTATAFCINIHNSTKYATCMHKINKTLEKRYKYTRPTFHYTHSFKLISVILETNLRVVKKTKKVVGEILRPLQFNTPWQLDDNAR